MYVKSSFTRGHRDDLNDIRYMFKRQRHYSLGNPVPPQPPRENDKSTRRIYRKPHEQKMILIEQHQFIVVLHIVINSI